MKKLDTGTLIALKKQVVCAFYVEKWQFLHSAYIMQ